MARIEKKAKEIRLQVYIRSEGSKSILRDGEGWADELWFDPDIHELGRNSDFIVPADSLGRTRFGISGE
ncbi:hypothetical protein N7462_002111 [Penicillium macrosclerotiorum]|uniref:uncharacterized protein n=1 Tax=Penicillium macrosclerotiorum TaxID=303699 RepID=UPI0025469653|nr:uncharacterized protein N7462_002111 [Penicillium macrosclerotiorum]KAJ5692688.1 hypothetical protein N7462_002111 [Penicillium macrosclerotiorum]